LENKILLFVTKYNKSLKTNELYAQELSGEGNLTGQLQKIAEIQAARKSNAGGYSLIPADDSAGFLLAINPPFEKYGNEKFRYTIFDKNLQVKKHLELELPYKDRYFTISKYILSDEGRIWILAKVELEDRRNRQEEREASYYYQLISINPENKNEQVEYEIKLPQKYITDASFSLDLNNNPIGAGFYGDISESGREITGIKGIFYVRINKDTKEIEAKGIKEFDADFVRELEGKRAARRGRGLSSSFDLKHFIIKSDGGGVLIGENAYVDEVYTCRDPRTGMVTYGYYGYYGPYGNANCRTDYYYVNNNIIAININKDGSIKWYSNIPKYQYTVNDDGYANSFAMHTKGDKIYFIYNDDPRNMNNAAIKKPSDLWEMRNPGKATAVLVTLAESGAFTKEILFTAGEAKGIIIPKENKQVGENEFIFSCLNPGSTCCFIPIVKYRSRLLKIDF
jgi:hypothetical protein